MHIHTHTKRYTLEVVRFCSLFFQNELFIERKVNGFIPQDVGAKMPPFQDGCVCVVLQTRRETESRRTRITGFKSIPLLV